MTKRLPFWFIAVVVLLLVSCLATCLLLMLVGPGLPGWLDNQLKQPLVSTSGQLSFSSNRDEGPGLYLVNADGSNQTRLTDMEGRLWAAAWSADGRYLAFATDSAEEAEIYVIDVDSVIENGPGTAPPLRLTDNQVFDGYPAWSPQGLQIAFVSDRDNSPGLYLFDIEAFLAGDPLAEPTQLARGSFPKPSWSPDGSLLALDWLNGLSVIGADGSGEVSIPVEGAAEPSWAPDGRQLVFSARGDLYRVNVDGSNLAQLTNHPDREYGPAWAPGGAEIAFIAAPADSSDMGTIFVVNADGSERRSLRHFPAQDLAWSPDGTRLAFYSNRDNRFRINGEIYLMNADGSGQTALSRHKDFDGMPGWRP